MSEAAVTGSDVEQGCPALKLGSGKVADETPDSYVAHSSDDSRHMPGENDAYVHVRVTQMEWPDGYVMVYLPDGTALVVPSRDLIRLAPAGGGRPLAEPASDAEMRQAQEAAGAHVTADRATP